MQLRIIDVTDAGSTDQLIQLQLTGTAQDQQFTAEYLESPFSPNFRKTLQWYSQAYVSQFALRGEQFDDKGVVEKLIKFGQFLGDQLLGEDHELIAIKEQIEEVGFEQLTVSIESSRIEFFLDYWETLVLPESNFVLSSVVKGFERHFLPQGSSVENPQKTADVHYDLGPQQPLCLLRVQAHPQGSMSAPEPLSGQLDLLKYEGLMAVEWLLSGSWPQLQQRLASMDEKGAVHAVQYDGVVTVRDGSSYLQFIADDDAGVPVEVAVAEVAQCLAQHGIELLLVAATYHWPDESEPQQDGANLGLACLAFEAQQQGLGNVVGLTQTTLPQISDAIWQAVYAGLIGGLSLSQAVVEARKALQSQMNFDRFSAQPLPFQAWPMLAHYGHKNLQFFAAAQQPADPFQSETYNRLRQQMFGFNGHILPSPNQVNCDNSSLPLLAMANNGSICNLVGVSGSGKTHLAHQLGFYLLQQGQVEFGFYFDFAKHIYQVQDMLEMVAPVLELDPMQPALVRAKLAELSCHFVFDNIAVIDSDAVADEVYGFINELASKRHVLTCIAAADSAPLAGVQSYTVNGVSSIQAQGLAAEWLRRQGLNGDKAPESLADGDVLALVENLKSSPFLMEKILPMLAEISASELKHLGSHLLASDEAGDLVTAFYQHQFEQLQPIEQKLLLLMLDVPGIWLEIMGLACHKNDDQPRFAAVDQLFEQLGDINLDYNGVLKSLRVSGLVHYQQQGSVIAASALPLLQRLRDQHPDFVEPEALQLRLSQIFCHGVSLLIPRLGQQDNPELKYHILFNLKGWALQMERLWQGKDYRGFLPVKQALGNLMQQEKLHGEMAQWGYDLLQRSELAAIETDNYEEAIAWLNTAKESLESIKPEQELAPVLTDLAGAAATWWQSIDVEAMQPQEQALFNHCAGFLADYYPRQQDWKASYQINLAAEKLYRDKQVWPLLLRSLTNLAQACIALGDVEQAQTFEQEMLTGLPFDDLSPMLKPKVTLDVMMLRIEREDAVGAQQLLDEYRELDIAKNDQSLIDNLQAEVFMIGGQLQQARDMFQQIHDEIHRYASEAGAEPEQIDPRLIIIKQKMAELDEKLDA